MQAVAQQKFWREPGKLGAIISFALLMIAYGFYAPQQERTLPEAVADLVREHLATVMPLAILTQWVLLSLFWVVFGLMMGVPWRQLTAPVETLVVAVLYFSVMLALHTISVRALFTGEWKTSGATFLAMFAATYLAYVAFSTKKYRTEQAEARTTDERRSMRVMLWGAGSAERPYPRWRPPPLLILLTPYAFTILFGVFTVTIFVVRFLAGFPVASLATTIRVDLVICAIFLLLACYNFRDKQLKDAEAPPALLHFIDLSLALSACAIALAGLPNSPVTLGSVPVWLVAVGPPLLVALAVFGLGLLPQQATTPRWRACLLVSAIGSLLVWPISLLINQWLSQLLTT